SCTRQPPTRMSPWLHTTVFSSPLAPGLQSSRVALSPGVAPSATVNAAKRARGWPPAQVNPPPARVNLPPAKSTLLCTARVFTQLLAPGFQSSRVAVSPGVAPFATVNAAKRRLGSQPASLPAAQA